jgi:hypothetical protein
VNRHTTEKEKCFETAVEELQDLRKRQRREPPEVEHQHEWTRDHGGNWAPTNVGLDIIYSILKTLKLIKAEQNGGDPVDLARPRQVRYPDVTVTKPDGTKVVVDAKFDRPSGGTDNWQKKIGMGGKDQRMDYNDINKQQQGEDVKEDLALSAKSCECEADPQPEYEIDPQAAADPQFYVAPSSLSLPAMPGLPSFSPAPIPIRVF